MSTEAISAASKGVDATIGEQGIDRRQDERRGVQEGAYAAVNDQLTVVGQILNVSRRGLAFRYVASNGRSSEASRIRILLTDGSFCLDGIPFKKIWDVARPGDFRLGDIMVRHCGIRFEALTDDQQAHLDRFLQSYTVGEA